MKTRHLGLALTLTCSLSTPALSSADAIVARDCYLDACAEISIPACRKDGEPLSVSAQGALESPHSGSVVTWQLLADAEWRYTSSHLLQRLSGEAIGSDGFVRGGSFEYQTELRGELPSRLTLAFGPRSGGHGFYDVVVELDLDQTTDQQVQIDVKPGSCPNPLNVGKKGITSIAVVGSETLDVGEIDLFSIRVAGVAPLRYSYSDVASGLPESGWGTTCTTARGDGYTDLNLKFATQELIAALEADAGRPLFDGEVVSLPFSAQLKGSSECGGTLSGSDQVLILHKPTR